MMAFERSTFLILIGVFILIFGIYCWVMLLKKFQASKTQRSLPTFEESRESFRQLMRQHFPHLTTYGAIVHTAAILEQLQPNYDLAPIFLERDRLNILENWHNYFKSENSSGSEEPLNCQGKQWFEYHCFIEKKLSISQIESYLGYYISQLQEILEQPTVSDRIQALADDGKLPEYCGMTLSEFNFFYGRYRGERTGIRTAGTSLYTITYDTGSYEFVKNALSEDFKLVRITTKS